MQLAEYSYCPDSCTVHELPMTLLHASEVGPGPLEGWLGPASPLRGWGCGLMVHLSCEDLREGSQSCSSAFSMESRVTPTTEF